MTSDYHQADKLITQMYTDFGEFNGIWQTKLCVSLPLVSEKGYLTQTRVTPEAVLSYKQQLIYGQYRSVSSECYGKRSQPAF